MHQLRKYSAHATLAVLIASALLLVASSLGRDGSLGVPGQIATELVAPIEGAVTGVSGSFTGVWTGYVDLTGVSEENERLRARVSDLWAKNNSYREALQEYERLRRLLAFKESAPMRLLGARVVGRSPASWFRTATLDCGSSEGVARGMPVVVPEGIAGRVIQVSRDYSKVLLANDHNSAVDAVLQRSRVRGVAVGSESGMYELKYIPRQEDVRPGDVVVSSGLGGLFPKGLPLGVVEQVSRRRGGLFQHVVVRPTVDFGRLEEAAVVLAVPPESG
jgi:rod shape-determining protein MreC